MIKIIIATILAMSMAACANKSSAVETSPANPIRDSILTCVSYLMFEYENIRKDDAMADSILDIIDKNLELDPELLSLRKATLLSLKGDNEAGREAIIAINDSLILPIYKYVCIRHFDAIIAAEQGNAKQKREIVTHIVDTLLSEITQPLLDSIVSTAIAYPDSQVPATWPMVMYYYYMGQLYGPDSIRTMLQDRYNYCGEELVWPVIAAEGDDLMTFRGF